MKDSISRTLRTRVGRRGATLLFLGHLDVVFAATLWFLPAEVRDTPTYQFADAVMPLEAWALVWLAVGLVCLAQSVMIFDRVAFGAAVALKLGWGGAYLVGVFLGVPRAHVFAAIFLAFAGWVFVISGWPEGPPKPATPPAAPPDEEEGR